MNIDQQLEQLSHLQYPRQVDVTDRVMAHVMQHPYLQPVHRASAWRRAGIVAAAAVVLLLVVNVASVYTRSYDLDGLGNTIAEANDYSAWNTVEYASVNPIEYLYED